MWRKTVYFVTTDGTTTIHEMAIRDTDAQAEISNWRDRASRDSREQFSMTEGPDLVVAVWRSMRPDGRNYGGVYIFDKQEGEADGS